MEQKHLLLISGSEQEEQEQRLKSLASWMGVSTKLVLIRNGETIGQRLLDEINQHPCSLAMSAATLALLQKALASSTDGHRFLESSCAELLVFGCSGATEEEAAISWLTHGQVSGVSQTKGPGANISFPRKAGIFSRQLAGLDYLEESSHPLPIFQLRDVTSDHEVIVAADHRPMFLRMRTGALQVFLLGGPALPDLNEPLHREHDPQQHCYPLLPVFMFLKHCFGESFWHCPHPTARLILDDPLLRERYGFLDYSVLLQSMQRNHYGTSIAFIPWNCWRTSKRAAGRVQRDSALSLCVHGCDHTNKEFELPDSVLLRTKAVLALQRMESMSARTGAPFEAVMVFPQGRFSTAAIPALRSAGYLAAVNSTCFPRDCESDDLRLRDFLRPAVTRYHGFPIFQRRYPRHLFDHAYDLFLGKPALIVEHHEYFRNGVAPLEELVAALYRIEPGLQWPTLDAQLAASCLMRRQANGSAAVRFFTRRFRLTASLPDAGCYFLSKYEPDATRIEGVLVDGKPTPIAFEGGFLTLELQAEPGQIRDIEILDRQSGEEQLPRFGIGHNARVVVRRALSEFRDNTLSRHSTLLRGAKWVANRIKVTGNA